MASRNMYGVVLWSDQAAQKAVIWCEDQGDLAFYTPAETSAHDGPSLDAGDLIQFDMRMEENTRRVHNPQLLAQSHAPGLAEGLKGSGQQARAASRAEPRPAPPPPRRASRKVVDLACYFGRADRAGIALAN